MTLLDQVIKWRKRKNKENDGVAHLKYRNFTPEDVVEFAESVTPKWTYLPELPTESGLYIATIHTFNNDGELLDRHVVQRFYDRDSKEWIDDTGDDREYEDVIAWQKCPDLAPHRDIPTEQMSQSTEYFAFCA